MGTAERFALPDPLEAGMLAIAAAIVFALALLFDLADISSDALDHQTLLTLGLLLVALHLAGIGGGTDWRPRRPRGRRR